MSYLGERLAALTPAYAPRSRPTSRSAAAGGLCRLELHYVRVHARIAVCQLTRRTLVGADDELVAKRVALRRLSLARVVHECKRPFAVLGEPDLTVLEC